MAEARIKGLKCRECGARSPLDAIYVCEECFGPLEVEYDYAILRELISPERIASGPRSMWRYRDLLPIEGNDVVDIGGGFTPLLRAGNLARALGLRELWIKNDSVNPSYSFKDRPVSVAASKARELGFEVLSCASTGNLACSVAAHAARAGMRACVFVPSGLEAGKMLGMAIYNPTLITIDGHYDDVNRLCAEIADNRDGWAFVNINLRPYYSEGSKTLAFEVAEQLGWRAPDHVIVPIGSGSLFTKVWKGYNELREAGLIANGPPRMSAAQGSGCAPVIDAWAAGAEAITPVKPTGIAKSLALGNPADGYHVLKLIKQSGGSAASAEDREIVAAIKLLAETEGVFTETAGGVTIAVLKKLVEQGAIGRDESVVAYVTGNGLKTQEAVVDEVAPPIKIEPTFEAFERAWRERALVGV
jgi:threonine synthase